MSIVLSYVVKPLREFTQVTWMNVGWRQVAADLYAKLQTWRLTPLVQA